MIGWVGNVFIILGILAIAYQYKVGFILGIIGNLLWCVRGYYTGQYDLITIEVFIVVLQIFSYFNWGRIKCGNN